MKFKFIFLLLTTCISSVAFAQLDKTKGSKEKGKIKAIRLENAKEIKKPNSIVLNGTSGFEQAYAKEKEKLRKKQEEEKLKNKGILTQAKLNEQRFAKKFKVNGVFIFPKIDQDLGSFRSEGKSVNIICRDFQYPDGDRITIWVNDEPVVYNITLQNSYQKFNIPLKVGINKIAFEALNQGSSGPNTAAFKVFDDKGGVISANEWNLATGAKATIIISKTK